MLWLRCVRDWNPIKHRWRAERAYSVTEAEHPERANSTLTEYQQISSSKEQIGQVGVSMCKAGE